MKKEEKDYKKSNKKDVKNNRSKENNMNSKDIEIDKEENSPIITKKSLFDNKGLVYSFVTFLICLCLFGAFYEFYLKNLKVETIKTIKDVTVTDTGIADAVEKV